MIPFELVTLIGSSLVAGTLSLMAAGQKDRAAQNALMLQNMRMKGDLYKEARKSKAPEATWVRQFIAVVGILAVIVWPKVVPVIAPWVDVWVGWTQWNPGFLFFEGKDFMTWKVMHGLVITPLDTHLVSAIVGFYLGGAAVKR